MYKAVKSYAYTCSGGRADPDVFLLQVCGAATSVNMYTQMHPLSNFFSFQLKIDKYRKLVHIFGYPKSLDCFELLELNLRLLSWILSDNCTV